METRSKASPYVQRNVVVDVAVVQDAVAGAFFLLGLLKARFERLALIADKPVAAGARKCVQICNRVLELEARATERLQLDASNTEKLVSAVNRALRRELEDLTDPRSDNNQELVIVLEDPLDTALNAALEALDHGLTDALSAPFGGDRLAYLQHPCGEALKQLEIRRTFDSFQAAKHLVDALWNWRFGIGLLMDTTQKRWSLNDEEELDKL
jgi:hypothetical protein